MRSRHLGRLTTPDLRNAQTESSSNVNALQVIWRNSSYICHKAINCQPHLNQGPAMLGAGVSDRLSVSSGCKAVGKHPADTRIICSQVWPGSWGWGGMRPRHRSHHFEQSSGAQRSQLERLLLFHCLLHRLHLSPEAPLKSRGTSRTPSWDKPGCPDHHDTIGWTWVLEHLPRPAEWASGQVVDRPALTLVEGERKSHTPFAKIRL